MAAPLSLLHPLVAPVLTGVITHIYCNRRPPSSLPAYTAVLLLAPLLLSLVLRSPFLLSLALYLLALGLSLALYRLSPLHPLARVPGPRLARLSRLWATRVALSGRQHVVSHELFARYGDVVRTGPDHLLVRDVHAVPVVLGAKDPWPKHPRYSVLNDDPGSANLLGLTDPAAHRTRRKAWDRAFTPAALRGYAPFLDARVAQLCEHLAARAGAPLDLAAWLGYVSTDFMGDFAYGGAFALMAAGADETDVHGTGVRMLGGMEVLGTVPWVKPLVQAAMRLGSPPEFFLLAGRVVQERMAKGSGVRDLFFYLLNEDGEGPLPPLPARMLGAEAGLAILAGSDTTGTALANAVFYLLSRPAALARLRAEIDAEGEAEGEGRGEYLEAVLSETLRLQPAIPNGVQRVAPRDAVLAGHVVPAGTTVQIPTWSLHRDPRYFSPRPEEFWPERWLPAASAATEDFRLDTRAYTPFNFGPGACVGRALALHEARAVLRALVRRFELRFAPGFDVGAYEGRLRDGYILVRTELAVVVTPRA